MLAFGVVLLSSACTSPSVAPTIVHTPTENAQANSLFARMRTAYDHASGVRLAVTTRGSTSGAFGQFLIRLRAGTNVGETWIPAATGAELVALPGGPTYERDPGDTCWRALSPNDPHALQDVGAPFPAGHHSQKALDPIRSGRYWVIQTEQPEMFWNLATHPTFAPSTKRFETYLVDATTGLLHSLSFRDAAPPFQSAALTPTALTVPVEIPNPTPAC